MWNCHSDKALEDAMSELLCDEWAIHSYLNQCSDFRRMKAVLD
jgi:hypothetical protein